MPDRPLILIVDDDDDIRDVFALILEQQGYRARGARSGPEALALLREEAGPPALILADMMMPGMSGVPLAMAIRAEPRLRSVPLVFVTGRVGAELPPGLAAEVVRKPLELEELVALVRRHIAVP